MSHRSLFKEVAQRIVQRAQSPENDSHRLSQPTGPALESAGTEPRAPQMVAGTFHTPPALTSPRDTSPAPRR